MHLIINQHIVTKNTTPQPFYDPFPWPPGWAGARRKLLDFMVQGKIGRGRHTNHPAGRHSIRTNQCLPPSSSIFLQVGCSSCHPTNSIKALKGISTTKNKEHLNLYNHRTTCPHTLLNRNQWLSQL